MRRWIVRGDRRAKLFNSPAPSTGPRLVGTTGLADTRCERARPGPAWPGSLGHCVSWFARPRAVTAALQRVVAGTRADVKLALCGAYDSDATAIRPPRDFRATVS